MIFTAYFDEADTHGSAPTMIMASFLGHTYQWRRFEKSLARIQTLYGFKIFHAKDLKAKAGEFGRWSDENGAQLIDDLTKLVRDNLSEGVTISLNRDRYLNEYRVAPIPKKMTLDSQYGVRFRACLAHMIAIVAANGKRPILNVVIEGGHKNVGDCGRIFTDMKGFLKRRGLDLLGTFAIATKTQSPPLMVSDFLAASYSMMNAAKQDGSLDYSEVAPAPSKGEAGLTFLDLHPEALRLLKNNFENERQQQIEQWRQDRAARKAFIFAQKLGFMP